MKPIRQDESRGAVTPHTSWLHLELARREMLVLADARGQTLACRSGELWLTQDGQGDSILRAGESLVVSADGCLVVSACEDARFVLGGAGEGGTARISLQPVRGFLATLLPHELSGLGGRGLA